MIFEDDAVTVSAFNNTMGVGRDLAIFEVHVLEEETFDQDDEMIAYIYDILTGHFKKKRNDMDTDK